MPGLRAMLGTVTVGLFYRQLVSVGYGRAGFAGSGAASGWLWQVVGATGTRTNPRFLEEARFSHFGHVTSDTYRRLRAVRRRMLEWPLTFPTAFLDYLDP